jgi:CubicO group peptidase (beta-lactamase class C family)
VIELHGSCEPAFVPLRDAFAANFSERGERGAALAVQLGERLVVDVWAGEADDGVPWARDTLAHAYSVSKPFVAACALLLWQRGALDMDAPVADYWPAYARAGKQRTTVRHVLTHQAGLVTLSDRQSPEALLDWQRVVSLLEDEPPAWEPGTRLGEHALFYGHLVGELVRRVDGRPIDRFLAEELAAPWSLDFHLGPGPDEQGRCAALLDEGGRFRASVLADPRPLLAPALDNPPGVLDTAVVNSAAYRSALVPAVSGHATARAIARFYAGLAQGGELDGVRLFRSETVEEMLRPQAVGRDVVLEDDVAWGLGLHARDHEGYFGMGGIGGFAGFGLQRDGVALGYGYVTRVLGGHERADACEAPLESCLASASNQRSRSA